jgi:hypothetical protein
MSVSGNKQSVRRRFVMVPKRVILLYFDDRL